MRLVVAFKDHQIIEFKHVQNAIYGNEEITYMLDGKIYTIKDVATFSIDEEE